MDSKRASKAGAVTFSDADLKAFWGIGDKLIDELRPKIMAFKAAHPDEWSSFKAQLATALYNAPARKKVSKAWGVEPVPPEFQ